MKKFSTSSRRSWRRRSRRRMRMAGTMIVQNPNDGRCWRWQTGRSSIRIRRSEVKAENRMDRAVGAMYEPGSIFKMVTLAAAFNQNLARPDEMVRLRKRLGVRGRAPDSRSQAVWNADGFRILAKSSDVGAIKIATATGAAEILRIHPRIRIWPTDRSGFAWRKQGI